MKKAASVFLAFLFLLTVPVFASSGKLSAETVGGDIGDTVTVDLRLDNPGVVGVRILVYYDAQALQLIGAENGNVFPQNKSEFCPDLTANPFIVMWLDELSRTNYTNSGTLCKLQFMILKGTAAGVTDVRFAVDGESTFDWQLTDVPIADCTCTVQVPKDAAAEPTALQIVSPPTHTTYYTADAPQSIDTEGMRVELVYADGQREDVTGACAVPASQVFSDPGSQEIPVQYGDLQATFSVTVESLSLVITADGAVPNGSFKKKIGLFSLYRRNPVQLDIAGIPADAVESVSYRVTQGGMQLDDSGKLTHTGWFAAACTVEAAVTDVHGGTHTASLHVIFYRFNFQLPLRFADYL